MEMQRVEARMTLEYWLSTTLIWIGKATLQASNTTSSSQITSVSGAILLTLAWLISPILIIAGLGTKKPKVLYTGIVVAGIMSVVTPLVYYTSEALRLGTFEASPQDFLLLTALSTLGGGIITFGILRLPRPKHSA